ncbi:MAG: hypothetical protein KDA28_00990, partial [Phycisphaerales bacterium]|nr:hypothetical protein [Phycisphaerales bacterium]
LNLESTVGRGTRFTMLVPTADESDDRETHTAVVLLDDARAAAFATALLRSFGFEILTECPPLSEPGNILLVDAFEVHEPIVRACRERHPDVRIIAVGDQADAWRPYDVAVVPPGSLPSLRKAVQEAIDATDA